MKIVYGILIFCFIVFFHELGHFLLAKANKIRVNEFSIGFGPKLLHFKKGETEYCLKLIPFGGSCMMDGEFDDEEKSDDPNMFCNASVGARMSVILAGPFFNFILALILSVVMLSLSGIDRPVVNLVTDGYPAKEAGILPGDEIVKINNFNTYFFRDVSMYIAVHDGEPLNIVYKRDGQKYAVNITPIYDEKEGRHFIGITNNEGYTKAEGLSVLKYSVFEVRYWIYSTLEGLKNIGTGKVKADELSGPVGIVEFVGDTYDSTKEYGGLVVFINMLSIAVLLSSNLGVMNLLPFPALDGGRFFLLLIEAIMRRKLPSKVETYINGVGLLVLFGLMIVVMGNDVRKLFM